MAMNGSSTARRFCHRRLPQQAGGGLGLAGPQPGQGGDQVLPGTQGHAGHDRHPGGAQTGIRASDTAQIVLDNCRVPRANLLGNPEIARTADARKKAFGGVMQTFDNTRPMVAAQALGVARAALTFYL